jgi:uncharacterized membrane protein YdcZ (DUF606 family)
MDKFGLIILAIFAGMSNGFQAPVNAALGRFVGVFTSLFMDWRIAGCFLCYDRSFCGA